MKYHTPHTLQYSIIMTLIPLTFIPFSIKYTEIRLFPSEIFYQGQLVDAKQISDEISKYNQTKQIRYPNNVLCGLLGPWNLHPVTFLDLSSEEERVGKSFKNESEVRFVVSLIEELKESLVSLSYSVAVITPYKAQVRRLKQSLEPVIDSNDRLLSNKRNGNGSYHGNKNNGNYKRNNDKKRSSNSAGIGRIQVKNELSEEGRGKNEDGEVDERDDSDSPGAPSLPFDCEVNSVDGFQVTVTVTVPAISVFIYIYISVAMVIVILMIMLLLYVLSLLRLDVLNVLLQ